MITDLNARQRLLQRGQDNALGQGLSQIADSLKQQGENKDYGALIAYAIQQLQSLENKIDSGVIASLKNLNGDFNKAQFTPDQFKELSDTLSSIKSGLAVFEEIKTKIDAGQTILFPKETQLSGKVDIGKIDQLLEVTVKNPQKIEFPKSTTLSGPIAIESLPAVEVTNFPDLARLINDFQGIIVKAVSTLKFDMPKSFGINAPVEMTGMTDLLADMEELKKGFNLLIKATQASKGIDPSTPMMVEIISDRIPRPVATPVTNISINSLGGFVKSRSVTVTSALTPLPGEVLSNRRNIVLYNNSSQTLEIGGSTFTFGTGMPVPAGTYSPAIDAGPNMIVYGRVTSGTADIRTLESSDIQDGR